jgi:hypothetical protein
VTGRYAARADQPHVRMKSQSSAWSSKCNASPLV